MSVNMLTSWPWILKDRRTHIFVTLTGLYFTVRAAVRLHRIARGHYKAWLALGPGGLRQSPVAWLTQTYFCVTDAGKDLTDTEIYNSCIALSTAGANANYAFLNPAITIEKKESRPMVARFAVPQRQCLPGSSPSLRRAQTEILHALVARNTKVIELKPSQLEQSASPNAIFLKGLTGDTGAPGAPAEVAHVHLEAEGSAHAMLSLADAKHVVEKCWGQRHLGSGSDALPLGFTLIYAPQTMQDMDVFAEILRASIAFMTGNAEIAGTGIRYGK